jgi:hypothetical protein
MSAASASSSTPLERRPAEHMRPLVERIALSPIGRVEIDRRGIVATVTPDEEEEEDTESPSPRAKRPRMLDFNMAATPVHTSNVLEQVQVHIFVTCEFNLKIITMVLINRIRQIEGSKPMDITTCLAVHRACSFLTNILFYLRGLVPKMYLYSWLLRLCPSAFHMNILFTDCERVLL